jgi:hypothetical protein
VNKEDLTRLSLKYLRWNIERRGDDHSRKSAGDVWWDRTVWYDGNVPCTRFMPGLGKHKPILLVKHLGPQTGTDKTYDGRHERIVVPDIGVFSRYADDMTPDDEVHERIRYILLQQVREYTEINLEGATDKWCAEHVHSSLAAMRRSLAGLYIKYDNYSKSFDLRWPSLPRMYGDQFDELARAKTERWNDPDAVKRRERAKARKLAKEALGLV